MSHHQGDRASYRELDQRSADGLTVSLEWNPATAALRVVVVDREGEAVTFPVRAQDASDAFVHPPVPGQMAGSHSSAPRVRDREREAVRAPETASHCAPIRLDGGARVAQVTREEALINTTMTQEVPK